MERDHGPPAEGAASFHATRWTIVMRAAQNQALGEPSALAQLCGNYWYSLYMFARRRGHSPHVAQDLTQGFFLYLLEYRALMGVDRLKIDRSVQRSQTRYDVGEPSRFARF